MLSPQALRDSWSGAAPVPFWLDYADRPVPRPALDASVSTDLAVVGGGFSGLWTALLSKERDAIYHFGRKIRPSYHRAEQKHARRPSVLGRLTRSNLAFLHPTSRLPIPAADSR